MDNNETSEINYLADDFKAPLKYATVGQRFINFLVDFAVFFLLLLAVEILLMVKYQLSEKDVELYFNAITVTVLFCLYIGLMEGVTGGKTLGKLITGTRAVYEDNGEKIGFSTAILRGLSRGVPFEHFSAFGGHPWHDRWTNTRVVVEKK